MHKSKIQSKNSSFSSTLLDEIYNSFDGKNPKAQHFFFPDNANQKQSTRNKSVLDRRTHRDRFFGSVSSSSDSNSSIFSSSDTELTHGKKTSSRPLCFGPRAKPRKTEDKALFCENRTFPVFDDCDYVSDTQKVTRHEESWENQRTRSAKSSGNFKKPKTPVSPGGRIVSFLNSLFSNSRKTTAAKNNLRKKSYDDDGFVRKKHDYPSTCSSASSFSRSCLNKSSEKSSDGVKRSVRFSPVNIIVSETPSSRSFMGKTSIYAEEDEDYNINRNRTRFMSSSLPDEWNIRKPQKKNAEDGGRRSVEEIASDFLRDYHKNQNKTNNNVFDDYEDEDEDDDASDSSSDLFELDLIGNHHDRYRDELPVYETTCAGLIL